jgi:hypothetical protein
LSMFYIRSELSELRAVHGGHLIEGIREGDGLTASGQKRSSGLAARTAAGALWTR